MRPGNEIKIKSKHAIGDRVSYNGPSTILGTVVAINVAYLDSIYREPQVQCLVRWDKKRPHEGWETLIIGSFLDAI